MHIGEKVREVVVKPLELPIPKEEPAYVVEPEKREVKQPVTIPD